MKQILITKASGEIEPFSEGKLRHSLEHSRTSPEVIDEVIKLIKRELKPGMTTEQIYRRAFSFLRRQESLSAARYSLKKAIREFGPTGHPFEKLVGELLVAEGFSVETRKLMQGRCVTHEVDIVAEKNNRHIMVECKFHNQESMKSDVKTPLYVQARFQDIEKACRLNPGHAEKIHEAWVVTNTKFTSDAIRYAECVKMKAIGWNYPQNDSLELRIDRSNLHPITCLTSLTSSDKRFFLNQDIVLCKELLGKERWLSSLKFPQQKISKIINEINHLCSNNYVLLSKQHKQHVR